MHSSCQNVDMSTASTLHTLLVVTEEAILLAVALVSLADAAMAKATANFTVRTRVTRQLSCTGTRESNKIIEGGGGGIIHTHTITTPNALQFLHTQIRSGVRSKKQTCRLAREHQALTIATISLDNKQTNNLDH